MDSDQPVVAGRRASVCLNSADRRVSIGVFSPDLIAELFLRDVGDVTADFNPGGVKAMKISVEGNLVTLRLRPEISVHFGAP